MLDPYCGQSASRHPNVLESRSWGSAATPETAFLVRKFIRTNKNSSGDVIWSCMAFQPPLLLIVSEKKPRRKKKEQKGEAEHERVKEAEYERVRKSRVELRFASGLSTDFIIGLKHITLKAKSNIKNDRRYKCGDWVGVTEGGGAGGLSATICQSELETIRAEWKGRWLLLSSGAASKLPQMWPCI